MPPTAVTKEAPARARPCCNTPMRCNQNCACGEHMKLASHGHRACDSKRCGVTLLRRTKAAWVRHCRTTLEATVHRGMLVRSGWSTSTNRRGAADSGIPTLQKGRLVRAKVLMHSSSICGCCYFVLFFCGAPLLIGLSCSSKPPTRRASPCPSQSVPASPAKRHSFREPEPTLAVSHVQV